MLKQVSQLKFIVDGKEHTYMCESDSQLMHCKEALFQFQKYIGQIEDQVKAQQEAEKIKNEVKIESIPPSENKE